MTRDEHRAKCIKAMAIAAFERYNDSPWECATKDEKKFWIWAMTTAFDSLHGVALVVPIEATEEMTNLWRVNPQSRGDTYAEFLAVCHAGNLTNQPEEKP